MNRFDTLMKRRFTLAAIGFELSLGLLGCLLSWVTGGWPIIALPAADAPMVARHLGLGVLAALPFLAGLVLIDRYPRGPFLRSLTQTVHEEVVPLFQGSSTTGLIAIALAAGLGEELLFRAFLQQRIADWWAGPAGPWVALVLASIVFGLCHSLCAAYAVLATVMGLALGGLYAATGQLIAPVTMHAVYDAVALLYLMRRPRK